MYTTSSHVYISMFHHPTITWVFLVIFVSSFVPDVSLAQQPTAIIDTVTGTVLVNGQEHGKGTVLNAGDVLEIKAGAHVVLELSDESLLELGENTKLDLTELSQTVAGGRVSRIKLWWGRIRAKLSPGHQHAGSTFDIETPNALIGVKFSQPDVEVSYDPAKQETVGIAHTVELIAINLVTNEKITVPVGTTVIIVGILMKFTVGTASSALAAHVGTTTAATTAETGTTTGTGAGTVVAIGAGVVAVAGGVVAVTTSSDDGNDTDSNTDSDSDIDVSRWADCSQTHTNTNSISLHGNCGMVGGSITVKAGRSYWIRMSWGFPTQTEADARSEQPGISLSVTMNGVPLPMDGNTILEFQNWWELNSYHCTGNLAPGEYTLVGTAYNRIREYTDMVTCGLRAR